MPKDYGPEYIELNNIEDSSEPHASTTKQPTWNFTDSQLQLVLLRLGVISDEIYGTDFLVSNIQISPESRYMIDKINELPVSTAIEIVRDALVDHKETSIFKRRLSIA